MGHVSPTMTAERLHPDGNCLGVALLDAWRLRGVQAPEMRLARLRTVRDAANALMRVRPPRLVRRSEAKLPERLAVKLGGWRLGLAVIAADDLMSGDVVICMRSMRQLYGLPTGVAHWVVLAISEAKPVLIDALCGEVVKYYPSAVPRPPEDVLRHVGPTLLL